MELYNIIDAKEDILKELVSDLTECISENGGYVDISYDRDHKSVVLYSALTNYFNL